MNTNSLYPRFSDAEFAHRYARVRAAMQEVGLSALVLHGTAGSYQEVQYLSNFLVTREAMLVFPQDGEPTLFVQYYNHIPNARRVSSIEDIRWGGTDTAATAANNLQERGLAQGRIGIMGMIPFKQYQTIRQILPHATFVDFTSKMQQQRQIKSEEEITFLRKGAEFSDLAIEALEHEARPGITEHELAAIVEAAYLGSGGKTHIHYLATTPMQNPTMCVPAQHQSNRVIEKGDVTDRSEAIVRLVLGEQRVVAVGEGVGPVHALDQALRKALSELYPELASIHLVDYKVRILDGRAATSAVTRVMLTSADHEGEWTTVGVSDDIVTASWEALADGISYGLLRAGAQALVPV